jgi:hypothetical protein
MAVAPEVEIKISDLSRVVLGPGDVLVLRTPFPVDKATQAEIRADLDEYFPGHKVVIMSNNVELAVVRPVRSSPKPTGDL